MDKLFKFFGKKKPNPNGQDVRNIENILPTKENNLSASINNSNVFQNSDMVGEKNNLEEKKLNKENEACHLNNLHNANNSNNAPSLNSLNNNQPKLNKCPDIVIVNSLPQNEKKNEGFYYKKYIDRIQQLQLSNPILVEREKMKVNFDSEVMDYLVNDMTLIFREKQSKIDTNQNSINKEIKETKELISLLWDIQNDSSFNYNMEFHKRQAKFINEVDYLEVIVNTLDNEADNLIACLDKIENLQKGTTSNSEINLTLDKTNTENSNN